MDFNESPRKHTGRTTPIISNWIWSTKTGRRVTIGRATAIRLDVFSMQKAEVHLQAASEAFLKALDDAPLEGILKDQKAKEWLETLVLRAFKKLGAARYHDTNLRTLVRSNEQRLKQHAMETERHPEGFSTNTTSTHAEVVPAIDIAYELDALLSAIRSSIDFGGRVLGLHLGMDHKTSITKVLNVVKKASSHPFAFLLSWEPWIEGVQHYRDECTHYRTLHLQTGYETIHSNGATAWAVRPVVIPECHGDDRPDTRMDRMMEDPVKEFVGLNRSESRIAIKAIGGTIPQFEHSLEYIPADGYILVEQFSTEHVRKLHRFLAAVFEKAATAKFRFQSGT
jgi:hypothetical protein